MNNRSPIRLTQEEFESVSTNIVAAIVQEAQMVMQQRIRAAGLRVTDELLNSLHHTAVIQAADLYAEFSIGFKGYGRFKDMKKLIFSKMPPIAMLEEYVRAIGLDKFGYVPGYLKGAQRRVAITDSRAVNRIAWGIAVNRIRIGSIKRKGTFYNPARGKLIYDTSRKMLEALPEPIMRAIKEKLEAVA